MANANGTMTLKEKEEFIKEWNRVTAILRPLYNKAKEQNTDDVIQQKEESNNE